MAALIAYYSRAGENYFGGAYRRIAVGNTEKAANMLAELTGGELYKIEQEQPYSEGYKTCIAEAKADLQKKARPEVLNLPDDLDAYDEIYLCLLYTSRLNDLKPDIVWWPVYTDYSASEWNRTAKLEYAKQAGKLNVPVLYVNSVCLDQADACGAARGGAALFENGFIKEELPAGQEGILIVEA